MMRDPVPTVGHWIAGKPTPGEGDRSLDVSDPATGELACRVRLAARRDVDEAVAAARQAFGAWSRSSLAERTRVLFRFRERLEGARDELAALITREHGKTLADAGGEVSRGIEVVEFACGIAHLLKGERARDVSSGVDAYSIREPLGVAVGITPFNFPVMVPLWMFPIAIACGNSFVLKPSEKDPSPSLRLAELLADAGLPEAVFNVVQGDAVAVDRLLEHPRVAAVSFVGSTPVARHVYILATQNGKRVQALGGAKNHMVVLPDADLDQAADAAVSAAYGSAGERCMAISAVVAVDPVGEELVARLRERITRLRIGPGAEDVDMGPLVTAEHRERVAALVDRGVEEGAELAVDGRGLQLPDHEGGFFLGPCLFDKVRPEMTIYREEIFGPVLVILRAATLDEAIELVNRNPYGNGTAVFTRDGRAAREFEHRVEAGMVGINVPIPVPMAYFSFGGFKQSLFGDLHVHGPDGVRFYTRLKAVTSRWPQKERDRGPQLGFPQSR